MDSEIINAIIKIGAVCAAIAGTIALIVGAVKTVKRIIVWAQTILKNIDLLLAHDKEQYMSILRLTIVSKNMPLSERIIAGEKYLKDGGNGDIKKYYENQLKPLDEKKDV